MSPISRVTFATPRGDVKAVQGVSLSLEQGKTLGIVGESGSGKTVLSRAIMGLLPLQGVTQTGSVVYEGDEILNAPNARLRRLWGTHIAMVFQDPMTSLNPVLRIGQQITEPLKIHLKLDRAEAEETAISLLTQVGIPSPIERYDAYPSQLSGGMRQRVMIAIALACAPAPHGRRADHRSRRHRPGADPRSPGHLAARSPDGHDPGDP